MTTPRPAAEAAEGTRPAGQAEDAESVSARDLQRLEKRVLFAARDWRVARETTNQREMNEASWALVGAVDKWRNPFSCGKCGHARCEACGEFPCDVDHGRLCDKPAAGVGPPVVAVAGREASATVEAGLFAAFDRILGAPGAPTLHINRQALRQLLEPIRSELAALRQQLEAEMTEREHGVRRKRDQDQREASLLDDIKQLEAERHGAWAAGHRAGWKDRFGSDCAFDQGYDPDEPTPNPYPPPPAEAPALPVGKETE